MIVIKQRFDHFQKFPLKTELIIENVFVYYSLWDAHLFFQSVKYLMTNMNLGGGGLRIGMDERSLVFIVHYFPRRYFKLVAKKLIPLLLRDIQQECGHHHGSDAEWNDASLDTPVSRGAPRAHRHCSQPTNRKHGSQPHFGQGLPARHRRADQGSWPAHRGS